jgi:hypothetical protein
MQNQNNLDDLDHNLTDLNKIKGEELINFVTKNLKPLKQFSLTFKSSNNTKTSKTHNIYLKAHSINFKKQDTNLENVFVSVNVDDIIGKKLIEYEDWHIEDLADTGNLTGPQYNLTLTFEDGYSIEIWDYQ